MTLCVFAAALGVVLMLMTIPARQTIVSPGPLTSQHASNRCVDCHIVGDGKLTDWLHASFAAETGIKQSEQKCLVCHRDRGSHALQPHSLHPQKLAAITQRIEHNDASGEAPLLIDAAQSVFGRSPELTCAACHREHHGRSFELAKLTDEQCQSCHTKTFHGFSNGHPQFTSYPYSRRTRLHFDHGTHYGQHFAVFERIMPGGVAPASCQSCHELEADGKKMIVRDFQQSCASCHSRQIEDTALPGLVFFALPRLDTDTLKEKDISIGQWPGDKPLPEALSPDGQLPALMQFLLSADKRYADTLPTIQRLNLRFLDDASDDELRAVEQYVWAIKELFFELASHDEDRLNERIAKANWTPSQSKTVEMLDALPSDEFAIAQRRWLPNLPKEIGAKRNGQPIPSVSEASDSAMLLNDVVGNASGWSQIDGDLSIRYRAAQHSDQTLRHWLEWSAALLAESHPSTEASQRSTIRTSAVQSLFRELTHPATTGRCMKCHTADRVDDQVAINWFAARPDPMQRGFTKFSHTPHLRMMGDESCDSCHKLADWRAASPSAFAHADGSLRFNPNAFQSDFASLNVSHCADCHRPNAAADTCLTCHYYHVR